MRTVYLAMRNIDELGRHIPEAIFLKTHDALQCAEKVGAYPSNHDDVIRISLYDDFEEWNNKHTKSLVEEAQRKLTKDELEALRVHYANK
jgi:hypothetical protein